MLRTSVDVPEVSFGAFSLHPERYQICRVCGTIMPDVNPRKIRIKNGGLDHCANWYCRKCKTITLEMDTPRRPQDDHPAIEDPFDEERYITAMSELEVYDAYKIPEKNRDVGTSSAAESTFGYQGRDDKKKNSGVL